MAVLTPIKAIRAKCLDCCAGQYAEVRQCPCTSCTLHPYRMGHRPKEEYPAITDIDLEPIPDLEPPAISFDDLEATEGAETGE